MEHVPWTDYSCISPEHLERERPSQLSVRAIESLLLPLPRLFFPLALHDDAVEVHLVTPAYDSQRPEDDSLDEDLGHGRVGHAGANCLQQPTIQSRAADDHAVKSVL